MDYCNPWVPLPSPDIIFASSLFREDSGNLPAEKGAKGHSYIRKRHFNNFAGYCSSNCIQSGTSPMSNPPLLLSALLSEIPVVSEGPLVVLGESVLVREVLSVAAGELVGFRESVGARVLPSDAGEEPPSVQ